MQAFAHWVRCGGIIGFFVLFLFSVLLVAGVLVCCLARSRRPIIVYLCLALLPLGFGLLGTMFGYAEVRQVVERIESEGGRAEQAEIESGQSQARSTTYLGITVTVPLFLIGLIGLATTSTMPKQED